MEIITVTEEISAPFVTMVPESALEGRILMLGCVDGQEIVSVAVVGVDEPNLELRFIYTDEPQRNRGGAKMIMEYLKKIADEHGFIIKFSFESRREYTPILIRICEPLMYDFTTISYKEYHTNKVYMQMSDFYKKYKPKALTGFKTLGETSKKTIEELKESGLLDSYDIMHANTSYSYILENHGEVDALLLCSNDLVIDLRIDYIYIKKGKEALGIQFLRNVIEDAFSDDSEVYLVKFHTITESMDKMVDKLLGIDPDIENVLYEAEYDANLFETM